MEKRRPLFIFPEDLLNRSLGYVCGQYASRAKSGHAEILDCGCLAVFPTRDVVGWGRHSTEECLDEYGSNLLVIREFLIKDAHSYEISLPESGHWYHFQMSNKEVDSGKCIVFRSEVTEGGSPFKISLSFSGNANEQKRASLTRIWSDWIDKNNGWANFCELNENGVDSIVSSVVCSECIPWKEWTRLIAVLRKNLASPGVIVSVERKTKVEAKEGG